MTTEPKPWAEPGLPLEERARRLEDEAAMWAPHGPCDPILEALRAARADALEEAAVLLDAKGQGMAGHDVRALKDRP